MMMNYAALVASSDDSSQQKDVDLSMIEYESFDQSIMYIRAQFAGEIRRSEGGGVLVEQACQAHLQPPEHDPGQSRVHP